MPKNQSSAHFVSYYDNYTLGDNNIVVASIRIPYHLKQSPFKEAVKLSYQNENQKNRR